MKYIGTNYLHYNWVRNFAGLPIVGYKFKKIHDPSKFIEYPLFRIFNVIPLFIHNIFIDITIGKVDAFHFFNTTYFGRKPWVLTIENIAPHFGTDNKFLIRMGLKRMAAKNCMAIIAMSSNSYNRQLFLLDQYPDFKQKILAKMSVLHPSQKLFRSNLLDKTFDRKKIRFTFVGKFFFHKGGLEILRAVDRLIAEHYQFNLKIVSSFQLTHWLDNHVDRSYNDEADRLIQKNSTYISYTKQLSNPEVLELMNNSDVGLLPSYGESYGYSVLESQAYGCPVITTNVWALEEINNNEKGWIVDVPRVFRDGGYESDIDTPQKLKHFSKTLEDGIYGIMKQIILNPQSVIEKGERALRDIRSNHSPDKAGETLKAIYDQAIKNDKR